METNKDHFDKLYWFCAYIVTVGLVFLAALVWLPTPVDSKTNVSLLIGFITGSFLKDGIAFLLGGNPSPSKKPDLPAGSTNSSLTVETTTTPKNEIH